jgi:hypothetical protein
MEGQMSFSPKIAAQMKRLHRRDENEPAIVEAAEAAGCSVVKLNVPVDLVIGWNDCKGRHTLLVEVKKPGEKLNPEQAKFFEDFKGWAIVARSPMDLLQVIGKAKGSRKPRVGKA